MMTVKAIDRVILLVDGLTQIVHQTKQVISNTNLNARSPFQTKLFLYSPCWYYCESERSVFALGGGVKYL